MLDGHGDHHPVEHDPAGVGVAAHVTRRARGSTVVMTSTVAGSVAASIVTAAIRGCWWKLRTANQRAPNTSRSAVFWVSRSVRLNV